MLEHLINENKFVKYCVKGADVETAIKRIVELDFYLKNVNSMEEIANLNSYNIFSLSNERLKEKGYNLLLSYRQLANRIPVEKLTPVHWQADCGSFRALLKDTYQNYKIHNPGFKRVIKELSAQRAEDMLKSFKLYNAEEGERTTEFVLKNIDRIYKLGARYLGETSVTNKFEVSISRNNPNQILFSSKAKKNLLKHRKPGEFKGNPIIGMQVYISILADALRLAGFKVKINPINPVNVFERYSIINSSIEIIHEEPAKSSADDMLTQLKEQAESIAERLEVAKKKRATLMEEVYQLNVKVDSMNMMLNKFEEEQAIVNSTIAAIEKYKGMK